MMIDTDEDGYIGYTEMEEYCVGKLAFTKEQVSWVHSEVGKLAFTKEQVSWVHSEVLEAGIHK